jgi:hypothetical protein
VSRRLHIRRFVPQLAERFHGFSSGTLRLQVQNRFICQLFRQIQLFDVRRDLFICVLPKSQFGTHKIRQLLYIHLHLRLQRQRKRHHQHGKAELHI